MKVFVAGASGTLGSAIVPQLTARGDHVYGLTHRAEHAELIEAMGAEAVVADALDGLRLEQVVRKASPTHVLHLLTTLPKNGPMRASDLEPTNRLRIEGTANLLRAAIAAEAQRIVAESFFTVYGFITEKRGSLLSEAESFQEKEANAGLQAIVDALRSMENQLLAANRRGQIEAVILRYGALYGPGDPATDYMLQMLKKRSLPVVRGARGVVSRIHLEDAASAAIAALDSGKPGEAYNIVDDEPTSVNEFILALAQSAGAKRPFAIPHWLVRIIAPLLATNVKVHLPLSNAKARRELNWTPRYPSYREGLQSLASKVGY